MLDIKNYLGGSPRTLNEINISVVLDRIRTGDNVSRSSLSKELNLSLPSISRIVNTLIKKKYVIEEGVGKSSGGKRPIILRFNGDRSYVIGIGIDIDFIEVMLSDLSGNEKKTIYETFPKEKKPKEMIDTIIKYINKIIKETEVDAGKIEAVALGLPAMQDTQTGLIKLCPTIPDWEGINLCEILSKKIKKDILIDNVANLSLLGEVWKGVAKGFKDVVLVAIGTGIGAGILLNGQLYRGFNGSAGEIGYMFIDKNVNKNTYVPFGQFEYLASNTALRRNNIKIEFNGKSDYNINDLIENKIKRARVLQILDNLAFGISNLIAVLNPELVIIRGALFFHSDYCFNYLRNKVETLVPLTTKLVRSTLKEKDVALGAVKLALNHLDGKILSPFFWKRDS